MQVYERIKLKLYMQKIMNNEFVKFCFESINEKQPLKLLRHLFKNNNSLLSNVNSNYFSFNFK